MRNVIKKLVHLLVKGIEHVKGFHLPEELPLNVKLAFLFNYYEKETTDYIRANIRSHTSHDRALDIGAHVGYYARLLSPLVERVYAFEPNERNYALLVKNTAKYKNIVAIRAAVSDFDGMSDFFSVPTSTFRHSLIDEGATVKTRVRTLTIDSLDIPFVCFVKIDVEGAEDAVLRGMERTMFLWKPLVIAEMTTGAYNSPHKPIGRIFGHKWNKRNYIVA